MASRGPIDETVLVPSSVTGHGAGQRQRVAVPARAGAGPLVAGVLGGIGLGQAVLVVVVLSASQLERPLWVALVLASVGVVRGGYGIRRGILHSHGATVTAFFGMMVAALALVMYYRGYYYY